MVERKGKKKKTQKTAAKAARTRRNMISRVSFCALLSLTSLIMMAECALFKDLVPHTVSRSCAQNFSPERLEIARHIITCNQDAGSTNYKTACLENFDNAIVYTDGTVSASNKKEVSRVFTNMFASNFTKQHLKILDEECTKQVYFPSYSFNMSVSYDDITDITGMSKIVFNAGNNKAIYQRDYVDNLKIYANENLPIIGRLLKRITTEYSQCLLSENGCEDLSRGGDFRLRSASRTRD